MTPPDANELFGLLEADGKVVCLFVVGRKEAGKSRLGFSQRGIGATLDIVGHDFGLGTDSVQAVEVARGKRPDEEAKSRHGCAGGIEGERENRESCFHSDERGFVRRHG